MPALTKLFSTILIFLATLQAFLEPTDAVRSLQQSAVREPARCETGAELADALSNPSISRVVLPWDLILREDDYASFRIPLQLRRNVTIEGIGVPAVTVNFSHLKAKVRLGEAVWLTLRNIILVNWLPASGPVQARDLDWVASAPPSGAQNDPHAELSVLWLDKCFILTNIGFPVSIAKQAWATIPRPGQMPGPQLFQVPVPPPTDAAHCSDDPTAPVLKRCLAYAALYENVAWDALEMIPSGVPIRKCHVMLLTGTTRLIPEIYPEDCVAKLGALGCATSYRTNATNASSRPPTPSLPPPQEQSTPSSVAPSSRATAPGANQGSSSDATGVRTLAMALGLALGGSAAIALVFLGVFLRRRAGTRRSARGAGPAEADDSGKGLASPSTDSGRSTPTKDVCSLAPAASQPITMLTLTGSAAFSTYSSERQLMLAGRSQEVFGSTISNTTTGGSHHVISPLTLQRPDLVLDVQVTHAGRHHPFPGSSPDGTDPPGRSGSVDTAAANSHPANPEATQRTQGSPDGDDSSSHPRPQPSNDAVVLLPVLLGRGSFGSVFLGAFRGAKVAVKVLQIGPAGHGGIYGAGGGEGEDAGGPSPLGRLRPHPQAAPVVPPSGGRASLQAGRRRVEGEQPRPLLRVFQPQQQQPQVQPQVQPLREQGSAGQTEELFLPAVCWLQEPVSVPGRGAAAATAAPEGPSRPPESGDGAIWVGGSSPATACEPGPGAGVGASGGLRPDEEKDEDGGVVLCRQPHGRATPQSVNIAGGVGPQTSTTAQSIAPAPSNAELNFPVAPAPNSVELDFPEVPTAAELAASRSCVIVECGGSTAGAGEAAAAAAGGGSSSFAFKGSLSAFGECAVEVQRHEAAASQEQRCAAMLAQEVEILGRCTHPNIVHLLAASLTPPRYCLVLERMETSLHRLIYGRPGELLPLVKVVYIAVQVCQGLEYLHPTIVHRDLKPGNVLICGADSPWPMAKLADFGLSRLRMETVPTLQPHAGTASYVAPECLDTNNNLVTHRADMYSFGVLLWAMLTGKAPWKGVPMLDIARKLAAGERLPLDEVLEERCPAPLRALISWCWEADPHRRPAASEALLELRQLLQAMT